MQPTASEGEESNPESAAPWDDVRGSFSQASGPPSVSGLSAVGSGYPPVVDLPVGGTTSSAQGSDPEPRQGADQAAGPPGPSGVGASRQDDPYRRGVLTPDGSLFRMLPCDPCSGWPYHSQGAVVIPDTGIAGLSQADRNRIWGGPPLKAPPETRPLPVQPDTPKQEAKRPRQTAPTVGYKSPPDFKPPPPEAAEHSTPLVPRPPPPPLSQRPKEGTPEHRDFLIKEFQRAFEMGEWYNPTHIMQTRPDPAQTKPPPKVQDFNLMDPARTLAAKPPPLLKAWPPLPHTAEFADGKDASYRLLPPLEPLPKKLPPPLPPNVADPRDADAKARGVPPMKAPPKVPSAQPAIQPKLQPPPQPQRPPRPATSIVNVADIKNVPGVNYGTPATWTPPKPTDPKRGLLHFIMRPQGYGDDPRAARNPDYVLGWLSTTDPVGLNEAWRAMTKQGPRRDIVFPKSAVEPGSNLWGSQVNDHGLLPPFKALPPLPPGMEPDSEPPASARSHR